MGRRSKNLAVYAAVIFVIIFLIRLSPFTSTAFGNNTYRSYVHERNQDQTWIIHLLPDNEVIMMKGIPTSDSYEIALFNIRGVRGKNIIGPIWSMGKSLFGLRIIDSDFEPWQLEFTLVRKLKHNIDESSFNDPGYTFNRTVLFSESGIRLDGKEYKLTEFPVDWIVELRGLFPH